VCIYTLRMFSNWSLIPNTANINFEQYRINPIADGSKVFASSSRGGDVYYSFLNGTTYTNWLPVPNGAGVVFLGSDNLPFTLDYTADGTTLCAQNGLLNVTDTNTDTNIYYSIYNGTTYSSWVSVPNPNNFKFFNRSVNALFTYTLSTDGTKIIATSQDTDRNYYYSFRNGTTYTNWSLIPNPLAITLSATTKTSEDNTKIVSYSAEGTGEAYYTLYTGSTYTPWQQIPNPTPVLFPFVDAIASSADGTKVFLISATNTVYYSLYNAGQYSSWLPVPNPTLLTFQPTNSAVVSSDGTRLYNQDTANNYYYSTYNGTTYSSWTALPNTTGSSFLDSGLYFTLSDKLFLVTADNRIYYALYSNAMYSSWQLLPNTTNVALNNGLQYNADGTILFAQAADLAFNSYYATFNGSDYTNWLPIPNATGVVFTVGYFRSNADGTKVFNQTADAVGNYYFSLLTIPTPTPIISDICFPAGTPVNTDQGIIAIDKIDPLRHTINGKRILHITQTVTLDKYLICIEKGALGPHTPSSRTVMTKQHKVLYQGVLVPADRLLDFPAGVKKVKYAGQLLYNILLEHYGVVRINNLTCETLHPNNAIAKLYLHQDFLRKSVAKTHFLRKV
jgi:hypothetical protein